MTAQKPVPAWARVSKDEYRAVREACKRSTAVSGFDWVGVWNLAIDKMEKRHANFVKGRAKTDLTLAEAVTSMLKSAVKERMEMVKETAGA